MSPLHLWLSLAWAQDPPPPPAAPAPSAPVPAAPVPAAPEPAAPAFEEVVTEPVWTAIPMAERIVEGVPMLGPWPDDWRPDVDGQAGLPTVDLVMDRVLDAGHPYGIGPAAGPIAPPADAPPSGQPPGANGPSTPPPGPELAPAPAVPAPAVPAPAGPALDAPPAETFAPSLRRSLAEDLLPPPPRSGGRRALLFFSLALLAASLAEVAERLQDRVRPTGALPRMLSAATGVGRGALIPLVLVSVLSLLPRSWSLAVPFALIALAFALGWSARELLADMFSGIVLTVERRVRPGERIEIGTHRGLVQGLGLRTTRLTVDDGRMVSIPNRHLLVETLRVDPDAYAPVQVPVPVHPHLSVGEVRQTLHELALLSPYIAPSRPPNVYRDADRPDLWIVEARLVHPRYANAFRGALVELADEQLNLRRSEV